MGILTVYTAPGGTFKTTESTSAVEKVWLITLPGAWNFAFPNQNSTESALVNVSTLTVQGWPETMVSGQINSET